MKQTIQIIVIGAITIVAGLFLLGVFAGEDTRDGVPVQNGANAAVNAGDLKACGDGSYVLPGKDCPKTTDPTATPTVNTGNLKACDNGTYVAPDKDCPTPTTGGQVTATPTENPGGDVPTPQTDQACLAGDKVTISRTTLDMDEPGYMVVDFYLHGDPQRVTALPFDGASGGSYALKSGTKGAYWIYPASCSFDDVVTEAKNHADDQVLDGYNMMDPAYVGWESSGFFVKK